MRRRGFTLVELLVVIGIIALLISILLPTLSRVRQHGDQTKCSANLHGMAQAWQMYATAYKICVPGVVFSDFGRLIGNLPHLRPQ